MSKKDLYNWIVEVRKSNDELRNKLNYVYDYLDVQEVTRKSKECSFFGYNNQTKLEKVIKSKKNK